MGPKKSNKRTRAQANADSRLTGNPAAPRADSAQVEEHFSAIGCALCSAVSRGDYCDTDVALGDDTTFRCMGLLLESHSDVLKAMLHSGMKEELEHRIELKHVDPDTFRTLLGFVVSGSLPLSQDTVAEVLSLCDQLQFLSAKLH
jgi:hypothetical protein